MHTGLWCWGDGRYGQLVGASTGGTYRLGMHARSACMALTDASCLPTAVCAGIVCTISSTFCLWPASSFLYLCGALPTIEAEAWEKGSRCSVDVQMVYIPSERYNLQSPAGHSAPSCHLPTTTPPKQSYQPRQRRQSFRSSYRLFVLGCGSALFTTYMAERGASASACPTEKSCTKGLNSTKQSAET